MRSFLHDDLIFKFIKSQDIGVILLEFWSIPSQNKTRNNYFTKYNPMFHLGVDILEKNRISKQFVLIKIIKIYRSVI